LGWVIGLLGLGVILFFMVGFQEAELRKALQGKNMMKKLGRGMLSSKITAIKSLMIINNSAGKNILDTISKKSFSQTYQDLTTWFKNKRRFKTLRASTCKGLLWPKDPGAYVIKEIKKKKILYIGMTGSFSNDGQMKGKQGLHTRPHRWNPYCFSETEPDSNKFCYGPVFETGERKIDRPSDYKKKIPIHEIEVDCFIVSKSERISPAFIESLLLQAFLADNGFLPEGNNKF
jgi:hypothetical protein